MVDNKTEKKKIENKDLEKKFLSWNIDKDKMEVKLEKKETKQSTETTKDTSSESKGQISLSGKDNDSGIRLTWSTDGLGSFDGFKLVKSKDANPVYPGDTYQYFSGSGTKAYTWGITDGEKYHFRVCKYVGGKCALYSNDISVRAPEKGSKNNDDSDEKDYATSVSLNGSKDGDTAKLSWSISGGSAPLGFKIVKSTDKNPVYPGDTYQYFSDSDKRSYNWSGFSTGDTYHFRICIYKGGSCGAYSNDVEISF